MNYTHFILGLFNAAYNISEYAPSGTFSE